MKELPIEKGCHAIVVNHPVPRQNGMSVVVGNYIGKIPRIQRENQWEVNKSIIAVNLSYGGEGYAGFSISEDFLMRIDGHEEQTQEQSRRKPVPVKETENG